MTGITYADLTSALQNLLVDNSGGTASTDFTNILPRMIEYAENRIYASLNFINTRTQDVTTTFTSGSRNITLPTAIIGIVEGLSAITPAGNSPSAGTRNNLERVSLDFIDLAYPVESTTGVPQYFALLSDTVAVVAPTPAATYKAEFTGIFRPAPLSGSNTTTYISTYYPALMEAACMVFGTMWQRDFGGAQNTTEMWESKYQTLEALAKMEEERRKSQGRDWTTFMPALLDNTQPIAMPVGR